MVICNIVCETFDNYSREIEPRLFELRDIPAINVIHTPKDIDNSVATLFYGAKFSKQYWQDKTFSMDSHRIARRQYWSYNNSEIKHENILNEFVDLSCDDWFDHSDYGIDVIFDDFDLDVFVEALGPWPLINEGNHETYIADWFDGEVKIYSLKNETISYAGINPKRFVREIYHKLNYDCLSLETKNFDLLHGEDRPVFVEHLLYANSGQWIGIPEITHFYSGLNFKVDRKIVIAHYLKLVEPFKKDFLSYK